MHARSIFIVGALILTGCSATKSAPPPIQMTASIKDLMDSMIDPSGDFLFESVAVIGDEKGVTQKAPKTDEEWKEVRNRAYILYEGMNLVLMEGRKVAQSGDKSQFPQVELEPHEIEKLIKEDRPSFVRRATKLQDAATRTLKATDAKDVNALFDAIGDIDKACENCHLHYWYPKDSRALEEARKNGTLD